MSDNSRQGFWENKSKMLGTALVLILLSFLSLNFGLRNGDWLYYIGLLLLLAGFLLPPLSRYTAGSKGDGSEDDDTDQK